MEEKQNADERYKIIKTNCDKNASNIKSNSSTNTINMSIIRWEKVNRSTDSTTKTREITKTTSTIAEKNNNDQFNYEHETINGKSLKTESFVCDFSLMSSSSSDDETENDVGNSFESKNDREQDEIFYDSTNESEDYESERANESNRNEEKTLNTCGKEDDYGGSSHVYLNDTEEELAVKDLLKAAGKDKLMEQSKSFRVAFDVVFRLIFPLTNGVVQGMKGIRDVRFIKAISRIASSRLALIDLFAYVANTISLNLSSVQVSHRIEPILKLLKIRASHDGTESLPDLHTKLHAAEALRTPLPNLATPTSSHFWREPRYSLPNFRFSRKQLSMEEHEATKCCTLNILAEPPSGQPIRADIVFIHGLNGSLVNTWKQGLWENERRPVEFQRPPKPPIRPPKRPRHSRTSAVHPPHHKKRARFSHADVSQRYSQEKESIDEADENNYSFLCSEFIDLQTSDGNEYTSSTFRLRMHDCGRLLQPEHDFEHQDVGNKQTISETSQDTSNSRIDRDLKTNPLKPSPDDPNYSKCWPGDWLPIDCPGVRVIALNYTTDQHLWRPMWKKKEARSNLIQRSREMIELLIKHRVGYGHSIVWVGHSKGGLFVKQIIVDAWESGRPAAAPFWHSSRGVFFYSVPHRGSHLASIRAPLLLRSVELTDIEKNNKYLLDLHRRFVGLYHLGHLKIEVFSFVETALTLLSVLYMRIVGVDSADPGIGDVCGIRLDHREICKPRSRDCILYKQLVNMINKVC